MTVIGEVRHPADWRGDQMTRDRGWRLILTEAHRAELLAAVDTVATAGVPLGEVSPRVFPLPTLGPPLAGLAAEVTEGRGFALVTGAPVTGLTEHRCEILALGVASHVGTVVPQGPQRVPVLHVRDEGADPAHPTTRSYQHRQRLGFHADPTDVVALLCVRPARSGGLSTIVSSVAVHNEIVRTRPDLADLLYQPWWHDRRTGDGPESFHQQPIYQRDDAGGLVASYGPDYIRSAQRGAHVPPLRPAQVEAMAVLDQLTNDPRLTLTMDLRPGDMQFLNNRVVLHSRTAYEDHPDPALRRDLIRLWLSTGRAGRIAV
ncbi:TauD/TfdA family dioxygenase [Micromonospora inyonensis]|uniref:Taurine catabolism dioxygenase TauD, TfdA family n=1 Tax=Micromonospora inyonensis TaxID=47866 RepID=A0A1C6S0E5_9ACTN|nr:TauD/TfdA family dioxygenase [Micromonospora inyonensis]SCL22968.1 Taurine catabolism dioxygenase TauD, TfdA family [Micromonospora inyonensis]